MITVSVTLVQVKPCVKHEQIHAEDVNAIWLSFIMSKRTEINWGINNNSFHLQYQFLFVCIDQYQKNILKTIPLLLSNSCMLLTSCGQFHTSQLTTSAVQNLKSCMQVCEMLEKSSRVQFSINEWLGIGSVHRLVNSLISEAGLRTTRFIERKAFMSFFSRKRNTLKFWKTFLILAEGYQRADTTLISVC